MSDSAHPEPRWGFTARLGDRSLFPDLEARVYLNHGGISPPSLAVRQAVMKVLDNYGRAGSAAFLTWNAQRARLRGKLAQLINVHAGDVALVPNTTRGITDIALCFPWEKGDKVVLFKGEFPSNVTPWQRAAELYGLEIIMLGLDDYAESDGLGLAHLERVLDRGVRLVAVSAVEFQTGLRMPIEEMAALCHEHGAELFVDGVQACGAVPLDAAHADIDYLACGSHKWLMGLEGAGFLYIRPDRVAKLRPAVAGWLSHENGLGFLFDGPGHLRYDRPIRTRADFIEGGNFNTVGFAALEGSLDLLLQLGIERTFAHVERYLDRLEAGLVERGFTSLRPKEPHRRSCILGVTPSIDSGLSVVDLQRELGARGVACAIPDGVLRFTPHWPNHPGEVPEALAALDTSIAAIRRADGLAKS